MVCCRCNYKCSTLSLGVRVSVRLCDTISNSTQARKRRADNYYDANNEDGGVDNDDDRVDNNNHCGGTVLE